MQPLQCHPQAVDTSHWSTHSRNKILPKPRLDFLVDFLAPLPVLDCLSRSRYQLGKGAVDVSHRDTVRNLGYEVTAGGEQRRIVAVYVTIVE